MKLKKLMLVTFLLLAILTIGAVSASHDTALSDEGVVLSQDSDDELTVVDAQKEVVDTPVEEINVNDDILSYEAGDFKVVINETVDLYDFDAPAIAFEAPSDAEGEIYVRVNSSENTIYSKDLNNSPFTLDELDITSKGTYLVNVSFNPVTGDELFLTSGKINVVGTLTKSSFDVRIEDDSIIGSLTLDIFRLYRCPSNGRLVVSVDGNPAYNESLSVLNYVELSSQDLGIDGTNPFYSIVAKFYTDDGDELTLADFKANYEYTGDEGDFYADFNNFDKFDPLINLGRTVFYLTDSSADGRLVLFVENKEVYNSPVSKGSNIYVSGSDLGITECGSYKLTANFTGDDGKEYFYGESVLYYNNATSFILIEDLVDVSSYNSIIAYVRDNSGVNGTLTLSINGKEYYNKKLDGTFLTQYILDTDLEGIKINKDFIGNYTVKVTYKGLSEESLVSFEYVPYIFFPYNVPVNEESYIVLKAASGSTGTLRLYDSVKVDSIFECGSLIATYPINGTTNIPLPSLSAGYHVFFINFTVNGKNDMGAIRVYALENSDNLTSRISSDKINVGESVTVTVTGPKKGGIDIYADGEYCKYISLKNGTVEYAVSNLTVGSHVISISYDDGDFEESYSKFFKVTVLNAGETLDDNKTDVNSVNKTDDKLVDISNTAVVLSKNAFTFNNKVQKPTITTIDGKVLVEGTDYEVVWSNPSSKKAGKYTLTITGKGSYNGTTSVSYTINKAANPLKIKAKTVKVKFSKLKKKTQTLAVSKVITFSKKGQGTLTYAKVSANKKITINKKTGKVTVKKGLKKGTYKVKVKVKAAGNANYKASAYKTVTFKIQIK